jgi:hypothetical protein
MTRSNPNRRHTAGDGQVLAVAWYSEVEWAKLKRAAVDPDALDDTYAEWCRGHADLVTNLQRAGADYVSVPMLVEEVSGWCASEGRPLDAAARAEFVARKAQTA